MGESLEYQTIVDRFFSKWEKDMSGCNYVVKFGLKSFSHGEEKLRKEAILCRLFKLSTSEISNIGFVKCTASEFKKEVSNLIVHGEFNSAPCHFTNEIIKEIENKFLTTYFEHIKHYTSISTSNIYRLTNVPDAPVFDIFWSFCYLISDHNRHTSIVIYGGAAD